MTVWSATPYLAFTITELLHLRTRNRYNCRQVRHLLPTPIFRHGSHGEGNILEINAPRSNCKHMQDRITTTNTFRPRRFYEHVLREYSGWIGVEFLNYKFFIRLLMLFYFSLMALLCTYGAISCLVHLMQTFFVYIFKYGFRFFDYNFFPFFNDFLFLAIFYDCNYCEITIFRPLDKA